MVNGIVYDLQNIAAIDLAHIFWMMSGMRDGILNGCEITYSGSSMYISSGYFSPRGFLVKLTGTTAVSLPAISSGQVYCNLVYRIDLSQSPSEEQFTQGSFTVITSASSYPSVTQEDLDGSGTIYEMSFAKFILSSSGVSNFQKNTEVFNDWVEVSVPVSSWSGSWPYSQSIELKTSTAAAQPIWDIAGLENVSQANAADYIDSFNCINRIITTNSGITLYCYIDKPTTTIKIKLKGI